MIAILLSVGCAGMTIFKNKFLAFTSAKDVIQLKEITKKQERETNLSMHPEFVLRVYSPKKM